MLIPAIPKSGIPIIALTALSLQMLPWQDIQPQHSPSTQQKVFLSQY